MKEKTVIVIAHRLQTVQKCDKIIVNESKGKEPEQYVFRDLNLNLESLSATQLTANVTYSSPGGTSYSDQGYGTNKGGQYSGPGSYGTGVAGRFDTTVNQYAVDANHVADVSLCEGLDTIFPFGTSILETVFKTFKQKELLEDAIIIYRVHRAPERRVFYIDVGNMPSHMAMSFVERVKNEIHQRRIPSKTGGGVTVTAGKGSGTTGGAGGAVAIAGGVGAGGAGGAV